MPYLFMPAKDPSEVVQFFSEVVDQGKMKVINAEERPDVWDRIEPCDDIRLIVGSAETHPPETADVAKILSEFRPEPDAQAQYQGWLEKPESELAMSEEETSDEPVVQTETDPVSEIQESVPADVTIASDSAVVEEVPVDQPHSAMDKPWTSFASRGFKG